MPTRLRKLMVVLGTIILIMHAVCMPFGMVYAETTMATEEQELVELPPMKNYMTTKDHQIVSGNDSKNLFPTLTVVDSNGKVISGAELDLTDVIILNNIRRPSTNLNQTIQEAGTYNGQSIDLDISISNGQLFEGVLIISRSATVTLTAKHHGTNNIINAPLLLPFEAWGQASTIIPGQYLYNFVVKEGDSLPTYTASSGNHRFVGSFNSVIKIANGSIIQLSNDGLINIASSWSFPVGGMIDTLEPKKEGEIVVNYINKQGKLIDSEKISGFYGDEYTVEPKYIDGYYLLKKPEKISGIIQEQQIVIDLEYVQIHETLLNSDFEEPIIANNYKMVDHGEVPGWYTTASDRMIEFGLGPAHNIVGPAHGRQFVELNANEPSELYQLVNYSPGTVLRWRLHHAGRAGIDEMRLRIGTPENPKEVDVMRSPRGSWRLYNGTYVVPETQQVTYFGFEAISSSGGNLSLGNLLDNIHFAENSELNIRNDVDKKIAQANDDLLYSVSIKNIGGVPADRLELTISGLENTTIDINSFKIDGNKLLADKIKIEKDKVFISPDIVLNNNSSIELSFTANVNQGYTSGKIETEVEATYWDETFDDISYSTLSNKTETTILTPNPLPVDPLAPEVEVDPENKPELPEDQGFLSIDFASSFTFGSQTISAQDRTYYAQPQRLLHEDGTVNETEVRPNYVQISDRRSENERDGWELSVRQNRQFHTETGEELHGAQLQLRNQQLVTVQDGIEPGLQSTNTINLNPNGVKRTLLKAHGAEGTGTWIYRFGDAQTADSSVALAVPKGATPSANSYRTTLVWELSSVPDN